MKSSDFTAHVILASMPCLKTAYPLVTMHLRYPRYIHAELMTHRVFSRNARSSRAVPNKTLLTEDIFVPHFLKNKPGMQASEEFDVEMLHILQKKWIAFAKKTQQFSKELSQYGVHKQWANRPIEWFGYIDVLVTSTEWENWFALRRHEAAQPEICSLATAMYVAMEDAYVNTKFQSLQENEWHIPYILPDEKKSIAQTTQLKLSVARCARISYAPFDGNASIDKEIERYNMLKNADPMHASPFEHQAQFVSQLKFEDYKPTNLSFPWLQHRRYIPEGFILGRTKKGKYKNVE